MACGTGKTFTSLKIAEAVIAANGAGMGGHVLFLVPSLSLLSQTLREWTAESTMPLHCYAVCSDTKIGKHDDNEPTTPDDLAIPATTDGKELAKNFAAVKSNDKMTVVFSTYQSIDAIHQAQKKGVPEFDLIICDEAHRTTGARLEGMDESHFVRVHDAKFIKGKKRLYMTATPRLYSTDAKTKAKEREVPLWSMDDETHYGKTLHYLGFSRAVSQGLLSDYKVVILGVDERVAPYIEAVTDKKKKELPLVDPAKIIGCWNALAGQYLKNTDDDGKKPILHRAVAFTTSIKQSKTFRVQFNDIVTGYLAKTASREKTRHAQLSCHVEHVDGTMNVLERNNLLQWLKEEPQKNECRILSNARCLSEGVDVPALDAVIFLTPRKSKVDVVQSVGRVMRKAEGKEYGYIILPVVIKAGTKPEDALNDSEAYEMVWGVLQALRAHDDRFQNQINVCELDGKEPEKIEVSYIGMPTGDGANREMDLSPVIQQTFSFTFDDIKLWKKALYATLVKKCGEKRYWEDWAKDVAALAQKHIETLTRLADDETHRCDFMAFLDHLRSNLNDSITEKDAIEMLAQHIITKPVFDALFDSDVFTKNNPVAQALDRVVHLLEDAEEVSSREFLVSRNKELETFYASVRQRVAGVTTAEGKQKIIIELYDKFFKTAFPRMAERLGIVYTPVEVVDFILHSVDAVLRKSFSGGFNVKGNDILDPFTGTGTFIVRLLQSGLIEPKNLRWEYENEIHANEIVLLAYYIAAANIENTFHEVSRAGNCVPGHPATQSPARYTPFPGIVHTDTFTMTQEKKLLDDANSRRAKKQKEKPIRIIIGNPPYSIGQKSANDNNQNTEYKELDKRIEDTYARFTNAGLSKSLYNPYIRAFRWASDRIGDQGVIGFVTNSFIDNNSTDGFRKCLVDEFTDIYVFNLRGDQRTSGEQSRKEGGKIFGSGSRVPIVITLLVKTHQKVNNAPPATIHYHDIGDCLSRDEKLDIIKDFGNIESIPWQTIVPNDKHDWINQRGDDFDAFIPIKTEKNGGATSVFSTNVVGAATGRDAWVLNFSKTKLAKNMKCMIAFYNEQTSAFQERKTWDKEIKIEDFIDTDSTKISWTRALRNDCKNGVIHLHQNNAYSKTLYRPFTKHWFYYDKPFIESPSLWPQIFPNGNHRNLVLCVMNVGSQKDFSTIITDGIAEYQLVFANQCFPLYTYEKLEKPGKKSLLDEQSLLGEERDDAENTTRVGDYRRRENISDAMLEKFRFHYSKRETKNSKLITKEDIFYYVYGMLHSKSYRERFAADLKKQLPRIPFVEDFWAFSQAGRKLGDLHVNYETGRMYPLKEVSSGEFLVSSYKVTKMKLSRNTKLETQNSSLIYNGHLTLTGIPPETFRYIVNGKSALEWIVERYAVTTHKKDSGIVNDPNDWCKEHGDERYIVDLIKRVVHLSVESVKIVDGLPELAW